MIREIYRGIQLIQVLLSISIKIIIFNHLCSNKIIWGKFAKTLQEVLVVVLIQIPFSFANIARKNIVKRVEQLVVGAEHQFALIVKCMLKAIL